MAIETVAAAAQRSRPAGSTVVRTDIQALRAVGVAMVLVFHLWPTRLRGGYVGVDVFFVISGFLITSHLLTRPPTGAQGIVEFWSRRICRLLPASLFVLLASLGLTRLVAPDTLWASTASQTRAAALYFVNWRLATENNDYLGAHDPPTVVRHFWSLSVEEQFYLIWPVVILAVVLVSRRRQWGLRSTLVVALSAVVGASFWYSVHYTSTNPARAYYVTPTRMWELGVGGLLAAAVAARRSEMHLGGVRARVLLSWAGLAAIAWAGFTFNTHNFPGAKAALPVLGCAAVIAAYPPLTTTSPGPILALRPIQWLGDTSYSVYLWHWPLIVLLPYVVDRPNAVDRLAVVGLTLVLAGLTKTYIEDRFRTPNWRLPVAKPVVLAAAGMALVVAVAQLQTVQVQHRLAADARAAANRPHGPCFGAAASLAPAGACPATDKGPLALSPLLAAKDFSDAYKGGVAKSENCFSYVPAFPVKTCTFGDTASSVNIALVGNSHAGEWLPALEQVARHRHWKITTYLASQCAFSDTLQMWDTRAEAQSCLAWVHNVERRLSAGRYDVIVMVNRISVLAWGHSYEQSLPRYEQGYVRVLRRLGAARAGLVAIRDSPFPGITIPDCLAAHPDNYLACDGTRDKWIPPDPTSRAVRDVNNPRLIYADFTRYLCPTQRCPAVIGGVPVYFDGSHMTATFNATLAPYLKPYLSRALHE